MGEITTRFPSGIEKKTATVSVIPNTETEVITLLAPDLDSTSVVSPNGNTQATLWLDFTKGSVTSATFKIYSTLDGVNWYNEQLVTAGSAGAVTLDDINFTLTTTAKKIYHFPIGAIRGLRVTAQSVGTTTGSSINCSITLKTN